MVCSCKSTKDLNIDEVVGEYQWYGYYGETANIALNRDHTFNYNWQQGLLDGRTNGHWELIGSTLILNSEWQPSDKKFQIISEEHTSSGEYEFTILDENNEPIWSANCALMKDGELFDGVSSDTNGICKIPNLNGLNEMRIYSTGYFDAIIQMDKISTNRVKIKMARGDECYRYFTNRPWILKEGRIIDRKIKRSKYIKKNYYERVQ